MAGPTAATPSFADGPRRPGKPQADDHSGKPQPDDHGAEPRATSETSASGPGRRGPASGKGIVIGAGNPSAEQLDMILSVIPDAAVIVDGDGRIVTTNANAEALFGHRAGTLIGQPLEVLIPERLRSRHRNHRRVYSSDPVTRAMGTGLHLFGRRSDGTEFPIDVSLAPVAGADRLLIVGAIRDVSDRIAAAATHAQLAAVVQSSADGIITIEDDGVIRTWNPGATKLFGYAAEDVTGKYISVLVPDDESIALEDQIANAVAGKPNVATDARWRTATGRLLDVAFSVSRVVDADGESHGFSVIVRDSTDRKAMESALVWRERWLESTAEMRLALLSGVSVEEALGMASERLENVIDSCSVVLALAADGNWADLGIGSGGTGTIIPVGRSALGEMTRDLDLAVHVGVPVPPLPEIIARVLGPNAGHTIVAALGSGADGVAGALVVAVCDGEPDRNRLTLVRGLAEQMGLAVRLAQARARETQALLADDRARIARDLHDHVIQALFATGMRLQAALPMVPDEQLADAVNSSIDELDATIARIRTAIFSLQSTRRQRTTGLRAELLSLAATVTGQLGFEPEFRFSGPVESLPGHIRPHLLAVAREAVSNAARHAAPSHVVVELRAEASRAVMTVTDDGVGIGPTTRRSGLANVRSRAEDLGGDLELRSPANGGTELVWWVPLVPPNGKTSS